MKIEKINDNQIRCILSKSELEKRNLKINDISYGTPNVKKLFKDMMQLAFIQCGFEANNIPLAIEVIPFKDYASITVTKVEDPDELDSRYSRFASDVDSQNGLLAGLDKLFRSLSGQLSSDDDEDEILSLSDSQNPPLPDLSPDGLGTPCADHFFYFDELNDLLLLSRSVKEDLEVPNALYKGRTESGKRCYLLKVSKGELSDDAFNILLGFITEFGSPCSNLDTFSYYVTEHYEPMIEHDALKSLRKV